MSVYDASISIGVKANLASLRVVQRSLDGVAKSGKSAEEKIGQVGRAATTASRSVGGLTTAFSALRSAVVAFGGVMAAQKIVSLSDSFKSLSGRLMIVAGSSEGVATAQAKLFDMAQRTRQPIAELTNLYTRLNMALTEQERTMYDVYGVTESMAKALAITGESSAQAGAAILQFTQAIQGDLKNASQEFNTIRESAPRLAMALENSLGSAGKSLKKMMEDGDLSKGDWLKALSSASIEARKMGNEFKSIEMTVGQAFTKLNNSLLMFIGQSEAAGGSVNILALAVSGLADNLDKVMWVAGVLATLLAGRVVAALVAASAAFTASAASAGLFTAAITALGGPISAIVIAIAGVGTALYLLSDKFDTEGKKIKAVVDSINDKFDTITKKLGDYTVASGANRIAIGNDIESRIEGYDREIAKLKELAYNSNQFGFVNLTAEKQYKQALVNKDSLKGQLLINRWGGMYNDVKTYGQSLIDQYNAPPKKAVEEVTKTRTGGGGGGGISAALQAQTDAQEALKQVVSETRTEYEKYGDEMKRLQALKPFAKTPLEIDAINRAMIAANDNLTKWADEANISKQVWEDFGNQAGQTIDTFISDLTKAEVTFKSFGQMALNVLTDVMQAMIRTMNGGQSIGQSIGGMLGKALLGSLGGVGKIGTNPFSAGGALYGPGFATGGSLTFGGYGGVDKNVLSMNGSPIARVSRGETMTVTPQGGSSGGTVVHIHNSFSVDATAAVKAQIMQAAPTITQAAIAGVKQAQARGYG